METSQRGTDDEQSVSFKPKMSQVFFNDEHCRSRYKMFGQGGDGPNWLVLLCLGLLNVVLLIVAVVLGMNCAKVTEGSLHVSHSAAMQLMDELDYLRSNHSDVIKAEEEAKKALETALKNHEQLKVKIEQQKTINDNYQKQVEALQTEKTSLQANVTTLEGSCGRCLPKWNLYNSSCYFFSSIKSTMIRKNWPDSRAECISQGADLIVIDNKEEQKFVSATIESVIPSTLAKRFWIGLTYTKTQQSWVWINNVTEVEPRYWIGGSPSHGIHLEDNCGVAVSSPSNPWRTRNNGNCHDDEMYWICEMKSR